MADPHVSRTEINIAYERKVRLSRLALLFERLWPRIVLLLAIGGLFLFVTLIGAWSRLEDLPHAIGLGAFALALAAAFIYAVRVPIPNRIEAVRRIERVSGIRHRPASSYEDTLSVRSADSTTTAIWHAHRARLAALLQKLRVGPPRPRTDRHDPLALRALLALGLFVVVVTAGDSILDRLRSAFRFVDGEGPVAARIDAWVTPPTYTGKPPIMLIDGAVQAAAADSADPAGSRLVRVPQKSVLMLRSSDADAAKLGLDVLVEGGAAAIEHIGPAKPADPATKPGGAAAANPNGVTEVRYVLEKSARITVTGTAEPRHWTFEVDADLKPKIALSKPPERTQRGSMKLTYTVEDDYGVVSAEAKLRPAPAPPRDPAKAWAQPEELKGPRPPYERLPDLTLKLPRRGTKEAQTYVEFGPHPWAGQNVIMTLEAKDVAGQTGRTEAMLIRLPEREFKKPLARAVIEQRKKLVQDPRHRPSILRALDALTLEPEGFIESSQVYLGLRTAYYRLDRDDTRAGRKSVVDQLWHVALRIEDGNLSDAERALKDAQDKLSKALEEGASDEEIKQLMQELRQALNNYMEQFAKNNEGDMRPPEGLDPNNQQLTQQDLERMMKEMEDAARNGSKEQAQQMLAELQDMLERLQQGNQQQTEEQRQRGQQMQKQMDELGNLMGEQQRLMDETFKELRREGSREEEGSQGPRGQKGNQRKQQKGQSGAQGPPSKGGQQPGEEGQQGGTPQQGQGGLSERQRALRDQLGKLQENMGKLGMGKSEQLEGAERSMDNAEQSLNDGEMGDATEEQANALEQMRQGAEQMAQQMRQNSPSRYGKGGDSPRDPLGRPQRAQGPDLGTSVKVPDQIDAQRVREILEELRRRSGDATRPPIELDYLERLLRRF